MKHSRTLPAALLGLVLVACSPDFSLEDSAAALDLAVTDAGSGQATFDTLLNVPRCSDVGPSCDSGSLLDGRDVLGPESHAPNTMNGSCLDGSGGTYHVDESLDRIRVTTLDGTALSPGKVVRIDVNVWAWTGSGSDALDLFYAPDASNPSWTYLTTIASPAGAALLSTTHTLLAGGPLQVIRGTFRYLGSPSICATGSYDDHDDLVFAVEGVPPAVSFTLSCTKLSCSFLDGSSDPDGGIHDWSWSFGDDSGSTDPSPSHTYAAAGTYKISLTVADGEGLTSTLSQMVTVTSDPVRL